MAVVLVLDIVMEVEGDDRHCYMLVGWLHINIISVSCAVSGGYCSLSLWRVVRGSKLMHLDLRLYMVYL